MHQRRRAQLRESQLRSLESLNLEIISDEKTSLQQKMWRLGNLNFLQGVVRRKRFDGEWSDLPSELQEQVLNLCEEALHVSQPTPIPAANSFPSRLLSEAGCFSRLIQDRDCSRLLTSGQIGKWLPAVVTGLLERRMTVIERCSLAEPSATEDVVLAEAERQMRLGDHYSTLLQDLPHTLWTEGVAGWLARRIENWEWQGAAESRGRMLRVLARGSRNSVLEVVRRLLADAPAASVARDQFLKTCLDIYLALEPEAAWPLLEATVETVGSEILFAMEYLQGDYLGELRIDFRAWPSDRLGRLVHLLASHDEATARDDDVDDDDDAERTPRSRSEPKLMIWNLFALVAERTDSTSGEVLERLASRHPLLREWLDSRLARSQAEAVLSLPSADGERRSLLLPDVKRALEDTAYRLIRHDNDLLEVLLEELGKIEDDIGNHLSMLYRPSEISDAAQVRHEEALQAYIGCRLADRLPGKVLARETQVKYHRRPDIMVVATTFGSSTPARALIEVKWSNNDHRETGVSTGLEHQLGERYLKSEGIQNGLFVVGWNGQLGAWHDTEIPRPESGLPQSLCAALDQQALRFRRTNPGFRIKPVVLDLRWNR